MHGSLCPEKRICFYTHADIYQKLVREKPYSKILLYYIFYLTGFVILEHTVTAKYIIHCPLDDKIPFCEWFLIPYASWFIPLIGSPLYFLMTDKRGFLKVTFMMFNGMTIGLVIYAIFPNGLNLRPEVTGDNLLCRIAYSPWMDRHSPFREKAN